MRYLLLTLLTTLLLSPPTAQAYDVDVAHASLTTLSIELYNACFPASTLYRTADAQKRLIQGNRGMDTGKADMLGKLNLNEQEIEGLTGASAFKLTKRIGNWHFYNPDRTAYSRVGLVEQSYARLWQDLMSGLASNSGKNALLFLGGLVHLVEDTSVPAHTIPVYHGPTEVAALGPVHFRPLVAYLQKAGRTKNGVIRDPIDYRAPDIKTLEGSLKQTEGLCSIVDTSAETPEEIRDTLARTVKTLIQTEIPGCAKVKWSDLWTAPAEREYFGRYNIQDGRPMFGERGTIRSGDGSTCEMQENDDRYAAFVRDLHQAAIVADLKLLRWGERRLTPAK